MSKPTVAWVNRSPSFSGPLEQGLTQVTGIAGGIAKLTQGKPSIATQIGGYHDIAAGVFAATPLGPFIALEGALVETVGGLFEKSMAKKREKRIKRNLEHAYRNQINRGSSEFFAARYAAARVGVNPEEVLPLSPLSFQVIAPASTYTRDVPAAISTRTGKTRAGTGAAYSVNLPAQVSGPDPGASTPFYNPATGATDTERAIVLHYGEGPVAEAERAAYFGEMVGELSRRPFPGRGIVPTVFQRLRR